MKAYELDAEITEDGAILLPEELAALLLPGQTVRVLILVPDGEGEGEEVVWPKLTAEEFYAAVASAGSNGDSSQ